MILAGLDAWWQVIAICAATFVSEDATCIATGLLVRADRIHAAVGVGACTAGIFLGDLALWLIGRVFGRRVLPHRWIRKRLPEARVERLGQWFDRQGWMAVLGARFLPGTRFPVYVAAGMVGRRAGRFALFALLAALLWTPALVLAVAALGEVVVDPMEGFFGAGWLAFLAAAGVLLLVLHTALRVATPVGRARLWAKVSRTWRWEFWPAWLFYLPLAPWIGWLALRYWGITTPTAANPGIEPHGGVVGESKSKILSKLPQDRVVPWTLIAAGPCEHRMASLRSTMAERGWEYPLVFKPDAGQRGAGLRLVRDVDAAAQYFDRHPQDVLAQVYHPGPREAGVFYTRMPAAQRGRIFSITDKHFPILVGDGRSTVETLIWLHPRLRMQAETFLARMDGQAERVPSAGEPVPLVIAGNHCQGTMFRDGAHLKTAALEESIDRIARRFDGFFFGRFDVRYRDVDEFKAGRGFSIIELNGVTSESTNLYDPEWSLWRAYGVLFRQWEILFRIGHENRRLGHRPSALARVVADARRYYRQRSADLTAD
ncbi:MAG: hypothetical protein C4547_08460 [Phycisphaerales bacterium]|nr:MAG: hypothetical protein C4547_08460 [Phycisphaerales bacterium]